MMAPLTSQHHGTPGSLQVSQSFGRRDIVEGHCPETGHSPAWPWITGAVMEWDYSNGFPNFNKLPGELRNMIWELALPDGRLILIIGRPYQKGCQNILTDKARAQFDDIPILQVCRESRGLASKYYPSSFERQLVRPIHINLAKDILSFSSPCSLFAFVSGSQHEYLNDLKKLGIQQIKIELPGLFSDRDEIHQNWFRHPPHHFAAGSILNWGRKPLGVLSSTETIGFACMRLGTVKRVLLTRQLGAQWPKLQATSVAAHLWQLQEDVEEEIDEFADKWAQSVSCCGTFKMEGSASDLRGWQRPEICATFLKVGTNGQPYSSTWPHKVVFRTQKEIREGW